MNTAVKRELNKRAIEFGESLMPSDCIEIMESVLGNRMDKLKYVTLLKHCQDMMATATDANCNYEISTAINDWMDS
jgi:hypothetical protein